MQTITITQPDDFHLHLRDGEELASVIGDSARRFTRAVIMPNLTPPVVTVEQASAYRQRILDCLPADTSFQPLMTLYLTEQTSVDEIFRARDHEHIHAVKYYPAGATTHAESGVSDLQKVYPILEAMSETGVPLLIHGEVTTKEVDIFDREAVFIETVLDPMLHRFEKLRVVLEHISTQQAVEFVREGPAHLAATITPHHLLLNRNAMFAGGLRPHHFCLPVLKAEQHRMAVLEAAVSGHPRFFLGTDSAPHARYKKESDCGCAGIYSAHAAIELYAGVFDDAGQLDRLEAFASFNGADFYGLPRNKRTITLEKNAWEIPTSLPFADSEIVPLFAGQRCQWKIRN